MPATPRTYHALIRTFTMLLFGMALLAVTPPVFAAESTGPEGSWVKFLGRMHVVVLHLPIGLLIGAFAIELLGLSKRCTPSKGFDIASAGLFVLGAVSSIFAVITGLQLGAESAGGDLSAWSVLWADDELVGDTLNLHMWLGVGIMLFSVPAAVLKVIAVRQQWADEASGPRAVSWPLHVARVGLVITMLLLPSVGHLGGNMTHGQDYLTEQAPSDVLVGAINMLNLGTTEQTVVTIPSDAEASDVPDGTVASWYTVIQPALNDACVRCHGPSKQNSGLRLDSLVYATKGKGVEFDYPVITAGDAQFSSLHTVVSLPQSHFLFMPPDPKDAFDPELTNFIGEWLQNYDGRLEDPTPVVASSAEGDGSTAEPVPPKPVIDIAAIVAAGGSVRPISQVENADRLTVKFAYLKAISPEAVAKLEPAADQIVWLTFESSAFDDEAAKAMPKMDTLQRLNLKDTTITDAGLAELPEFVSLTWLNLFGTDITDAGLEALAKYDLLEKLYLTGTKVTAEGVVELRKAMPDTEIFSDHDGQFQFTPVTPDAKPGDPVNDDKAAAKPVNDKCPVSGAPVKPEFVSTFEGKSIAFCCKNCKAKFDADPKTFASKIQ